MLAVIGLPLKPLIDWLVPKLVGMATTLRHSISAMSSPLTACRWLSYKQNYSQSKAKNWLPWQRPLAHVDSHLTHDSLRPSEPTTQTAFRSVQSFFCTDDLTMSLYFTMGRLFSYKNAKMPLPMGIHRSLNPTEASLVWRTDRQTDRQTTLLGW